MLMSTVGGFLGTAYLITSTLMGSYLSFTYDKSMMKRLFYKERKSNANQMSSETGRRRTNEEELIFRLQDRESYSLGYWEYLMTRMGSSFCCCFKRCYPNYDRKLRSLRKLEKAREMLTAEKDVESLIMLRRVTHLLIKVMLKPH
mmetsp:Transcript_46455/g.61545  ORF Transcript_46455/g.61545 Transcript_46455/m.61545 type:complete len:145 (+) Transcript_46455:622-1056(+)